MTFPPAPSSRPESARDALVLDGLSLDLPALEAVAVGRSRVELAPSAREGVAASREVVDRAVRENRVVYGVNTGFGNFADVVIPQDRVRELQLNLVRSHAAGVGDPLPEAETRALMLLRANVLARGFSGVRPETLQRLLDLINHGLHPIIPCQGSVGASGDLAPLAHLALALIGEGDCLYGSRRQTAAAALSGLGLAPIALEAKEGLALINGTQFMTAVAGLALCEAWRLVALADIVGALTLDALHGTDVAFDPRIHAARPHPGQQASARNLRKLLADSPLRESHRNCGKVQDAYSLRCMPQVHGAVRDALAYVTRTIEIEMNSATDNPMVFAAEGELLSGGNFHGEPVAIAADTMSIAVAELGAISERRMERLVNPALSDLPAFLTPEGGLHSGFMMGHVTAAALASENKSLAHPASVDSIPTSANKEDHVSMGPIAARKAAQVTRNVRRILALELLAACQALELRRPVRSSAPLEAVHALVRRVAPAWDRDRFLSPDIEAVAELCRSGELVTAAEAACGSLE
ncbi:MAG: histidine ammonia-lyase [Vicinamibacteria bacterium]|nr:histidine ammonia-lyase [Vicinamibacteria bacterium]